MGKLKRFLQSPTEEFGQAGKAEGFAISRQTARF